MEEAKYENQEESLVDDIIYSGKHQLPVVGQVRPTKTEDGFNLPENKDIVFDIVRDVEFILVRVLPAPGPSQEASAQPWRNIREKLVNKEFHVPAGYEEKLKFVLQCRDKARRYTVVSQIINDLPRFVQVEAELLCPSSGSSKCEKLPVKTKLELKWVYSKNTKDGKMRFAKFTSGSKVYTLAETQSVQMTPLSDPRVYTIQEISRFALLPATIQFVEPAKEVTGGPFSWKHSSTHDLASIICSGPLKLICFEVRDVGVATICGMYKNDSDAMIIPAGACKQTVTLLPEKSTDTYSNVTLSSSQCRTFATTTLYATSTEQVWIAKICKGTSQRKKTGNADSSKVFEMGSSERSHKGCRTNEGESDLYISMSPPDNRSFQSKAEHTKQAENGSMVYETMSINTEESNSISDYFESIRDSEMEDSLYSDISFSCDSSLYDNADGNKSASRTSDTSVNQESDKIIAVDGSGGEKCADKETEFFTYSVSDVVECLKKCSMSEFAQKCSEQALDGSFFKTLDLAIFKSDPFSLSEFDIVKLNKIIHTGWRPKS